MPYLGVTKTMTCRGCAAKYTATSTGRLPQWCSPECKRTNGPKCKICGDRAKSIDLCAKHWHQFKNHGGATATRTCKQCGKTYQESAEGRGKARATCSTDCHDARTLEKREARSAALAATQCSIELCDKPIRSTGSPYCEMHYGRVRFQGAPGEPEERPYRFRDEHWGWVGDEATYRTVHSRMTRELGAAFTHSCVDCGAQAHHWSYNHTDPNERWGCVNRGKTYLVYSPDASHYSPRCASCHRKFDRENA